MEKAIANLVEQGNPKASAATPCSGRDILMQQQSERAANLHALATRLELTIKQTGDRFTLRRTADVARPVREEGPYFR